MIDTAPAPQTDSPDAPRPSGAARTGMSRRALFGGAAALALASGGGTAWALDRFVIEHAEVTDASSTWSTSTTSSTTSDSTATTTGTTYTGANATVSISSHTSGSGSDTLSWYVADITLTSAEALMTAFAKDTFGENIIEVPSTIAANNNAVFAINGDYYGFRDTGIVIRNGVAFRDKGARQGLALDRTGNLFLYDETATNADALVSDGVWQAWSFGPGIVDGGQVVSGIDSIEIDTNVGNHSIQGTQPRTGFGMIDTNHLVAMVVDGRSNGYSRGVTMTEFAQMFSDLGAQVAYNLDGGGSSTMVFDDTLVNRPRGGTQERGSSDIIYVGR